MIAQTLFQIDPTSLLASAGSIFGMPPQASTVAHKVDWIYDVITWISIFFFLVIVIAMGYFMWKYRRVSHVADTGGPSHHTPLEVTWTVIPLILVIGIFYIGMKGYIDLQQAPTGAYEVYVTAQKWSWTFTHRNGASGPQLDVPAGRPVKLIATSQDVLHAMFIPSFRVKIDVVPGRVRTLWFEIPDTTDETRVYDFMCAEYCGTQHSQMITKVNVIPAARWEAHIEEQARIVDRLGEDKLACYAALRLYPRCASCHTLDGRDMTGPSFKGLWERTTAGEQVFTDGSTLADIMGPGKTYENPEDFIRQSILNPQKHVRQNFTGAMPAFQGQLKEREVLALLMLLKDPSAIMDEKGKVIVPCDLTAPAGAGTEGTGGTGAVGTGGGGKAGETP